ncbi:hypothetical protein IQ255_08390 [Pleurocapsales cyanobacterium LEGE 10410]|nr:hypothetical protein [Pleurocapsales cyanobacterium LEGE 10410]
MTSELALIKSAVELTADKSNLPQPSTIVTALTAYEKNVKKETTCHSLSNLIGSWNLRFITGTKKSQKKAGVVLGAGRYIPKLIKIQITYESDRPQTVNAGRVRNSVKLGFLNLCLSGPIKFLPQQNILAFDFTTITIAAFDFKIYDGYLKNGVAKETEFYQTALKHQAFFRYFLIQENLIAARGRGGGLALWSREKNSPLGQEV